MPRTSNRILMGMMGMLGVTLAFATGVACGDLEEALDKQECFSGDDCGSLPCVVANPDGLNPTGLGWCLDDTTCAVGEQPYCPCGLDPSSSEPLCASPSDSNRLVQGTVACWDEVDMGTCLCLPPNVTCEYADT